MKKFLSKHKGIFITLGVVFLLAACAVSVFFLNRFAFYVEQNGGDVFLEYGQEYVEEGANSKLRGELFFKDGRNTESFVQIQGDVDTSKVGDYVVSYSSEYLFWTANAQRTVHVLDKKPPVIKLNYIPDSFTIDGFEYEEEGFEAFDEYDGDLTDKVQKVFKNGVFIYTVSDAAGNSVSVERKINIIYPDPPVITLLGDKEVKIYQTRKYTESGFSAVDWFGVDLTDRVQVNGKVDTSVPGDYIIEYVVTDDIGKTSKVQRTVTVMPLPDAPTVTLLGSERVNLYTGNVYKEAGFSAVDYKNTDLTSKVKVEGKVDTSKVGQYVLVYSVSDEFGQVAKINRVVTVVAPPKPQEDKPAVSENDKVVYLTFDDGPSKYTMELLDVLDKYNVKATFFVIDSGRYDVMKEIVKRGNSIGIHSLSHKYKDIYASKEAYFKDIYGMQNLIYEKTGVLTTLMRFPGGSSNRVSSFNPGIMTVLTKAVEDAGFQYFDWNVDSCDASNAKTTQAVYENVMAGIKKRKNSVVLQHDTSKVSVAAVEQIIITGLQNGYVFLPLTPDSPTAHHNVQN